MKGFRGLLWASVVSAGLLACSPTPTSPNFILIVTDDQEVDTLRFMPIVQRELVAQGTSFVNSFTTITACCPSRVSILRGQYSHNHGVLQNGGANGGFQGLLSRRIEESNLATWMQDAGYRTALIGKFVNGYLPVHANYVPPGWSEWFAMIDHEFFETRISHNGRLIKEADYLTDAITRRAVNFIEQDDSRPFFLYLTPLAPHKPAQPAPRHRERFANLVTPRIASFNESDVSDKAAFVRLREPLSVESIEEMDGLYRNRIRTLLAVDEMVGEIVSALEKTAQLEKTFIFFTSDSGYHLGQHRLPGGKGGPYEAGIRTPLLVRGPGVPAARSVDPLVLHNDLAPTISALSGVTAPDYVDGRSLLPWLGIGEPAEEGWRQAFLIENWRKKADGFLALRTRHQLYVEFRNGEREFYDLRDDPHQLRNSVAGLDPQRVDRLSAALARLGHCVAAECRRLEDRLGSD